MEPIYLGTIVNSRGYSGEIKLDDVLPDCPNIPEGTEVLVGYSPNFSQSYIVEKWKNNKTFSNVKLKNINDDVEAARLKEHGIFIDEDLLNSFVEDSEVIRNATGIMVYNSDSDELIGEVIEEWDLPANKVWLIQTESGRLPVPVNEIFISSFDKQTKIAKLNVLDGLMDLLEKDE